MLLVLTSHHRRLVAFVHKYMATRRMISKEIIDTDAFMEMPLSSQALYFHLLMRADDDGFVGNPRKITRMVNAQEDDVKVLLSKRFIIAFESGVMVIKHWKIHNYIQNDRYHETKYLEEKKSLKTKDNGAYTECIQNGYKMDTEVRLGKVRLGKDSIGKDTSEQSSRIAELIKSFEEINPACKRMYGNTTQRKACNDLIETYSFERVKEVIEKTLPKIRGLKFFPIITTPLQLFEKWSALESAVVRHQQDQKPKYI